MFIRRHIDGVEEAHIIQTSYVFATEATVALRIYLAVAAPGTTAENLSLGRYEKSIRALACKHEIICCGGELDHLQPSPGATALLPSLKL
jgi:hypothetical protein